MDLQDYSPVVASQTVGVLGSGREPHLTLAEPLGRLLAGLGVNLLTGGGGGTMEAVARAYVAMRPAKGTSIGILPASPEDVRRPPAGYPNAYVQLAIATHLPDRGNKGHLPTSRNHLSVLTSDVLIALPGSSGTESEVLLAVEYGRPLAIYSPDESLVERFSAAVQRLGTLSQVEHFLRSALKPEGSEFE
jgi:uncharacterized protein (TIGR00725 family)